MTTPPTIYNIFHEGDLYEVSVRNSIIISVVRFLGDSELRSVIPFDDLSPIIQHKILIELSHAETP